MRLPKIPVKPWTTTILMIVIILFISGAVYCNALFNGFVHDDVPQVVNNPWIRDIGYIPKIFTANVWDFMGGVSNYYRPLMFMIYMLDYYLFGLEPWGFHLVNILLHSGVSVLVFLIIAKLLTQARPVGNATYLLPAFAAAVLFAANPVHTEAVTWIAGLPELSFTLFFLLSFYFYLRAREGGRGNYPLSVLFFFLSTLCKETALALPIILVAYDVAFRQKEASIRDFFKRYAPYVLVAVIYFVLRTYALGGFSPLMRHRELTNYEYFINIFPLFSQYLLTLLLPFKLNAFHVFHPIQSIFAVKGIISLAATMAFAVMAFVAFKKNKALLFGSVLIAVPLLPVLYIPGLGENTFAERYLYLPSIGFALMSALFITWAMQKPGGAKAMTAGCVLMTVAYCAVTVNINAAVWKDNYTFWTVTVKKSPDSAVAHYNLGNNLISQFRIDEAIEQYQTAIRLKPTADVYFNLGRAYDMKRWTEQAVEQYRHAVMLNPEEADPYTYLGVDYAMMGLIDKAIENLEIAIRLNPSDPFIRSTLERAYRMREPSGKDRADDRNPERSRQGQ
jgi:hypothetical protein